MRNASPGDDDAEWIVVLDAWIDGTGATPDEVLEQLITDGGDDSSGMGGMGHGSMGGMGMGDPPWGEAGDVIYPHFLVNGRTPTDPEVLTARPGQRVRLRIISAASDTIFTVAIGGHRMTITHSDGFPVEPAETDAISCRHNCVCPENSPRTCTVRRRIPGSVAFVPSVAGLILAGVVVRDLIAGRETR